MSHETMEQLTRWFAREMKQYDFVLVNIIGADDRMFTEQIQHPGEVELDGSEIIWRSGSDKFVLPLLTRYERTGQFGNIAAYHVEVDNECWEYADFSKAYIEFIGFKEDKKMKKETATFAVVADNHGVIKQIGRSVISQPVITFDRSRGGVKWFDDSQLIRK